MPARLLIASSEESDMRYATGLDVPDPFIWMRLESAEHILVSKLEYSRVRREARRGVKVVLWDGVDLSGLRKAAGRKRNVADIAAAYLLSYNATEIVVPERFWAQHLETLREHGLRVRIASPFFEQRKVKRQDEIRHIKATGAVAKRALRRALEMLRDATIEWDDTLILDGERLTSERVREEIERVFVSHGCASGQTIVACGAQSAEPHNRGSGPLYAGVPIILDLFPRDTRTGYYFDMTRTVVKGTPSAQLKRMHATVRRAQQAALDAVAPGKARLAHDACAGVFARAGYATSEEEGFIHSTGHGLGLDIHEAPRLSEKSDERLEAGYVVTVEPGLYYKELGGVRIEDTVLVTKTGCVNLTNVPKTFVIP